MLARRKLRRRIDDALAIASPLALAEAMDTHICTRPASELRTLIERSAVRMDAAERAQLNLYLNSANADDELIGYRFSAFLRQNPTAIAALDQEAIDAILTDVGEAPKGQTRGSLSVRMWGLLAGVFALALLPLAAQYAHQRGLVEGLSEPFTPAPVVPFVQTVALRHAPPVKHVHHAPARVAHYSKRVRHVAQSAPVAHHTHARAYHAHVHSPVAVAWKFDRRNNPYFNRSRWTHPYADVATRNGARARLSVDSYLRALVAGNVPAALAHLGLRRNADRSALAELPIITHSTRVAIAGTKPQLDGTVEVQADIMTGGREYFEVFHVARDGPAMRIVDRYYIPVNRRAQVAERLLVEHPH